MRLLVSKWTMRVINLTDKHTMKTVFVTVGTTRFDDLISTVSGQEFIEAIKSKGYERILLQVGNGSVIPQKCTISGIELDVFKFKPSIDEEIKNASLVVSHAGSGSILETLKAKRPLIVVVNEKLMDNHQVELAEAFQKLNNLYYCTCRTLLSVVKEKDLSSLSPYAEGRPDMFGSYLFEFMGLKNEES